MTEEDLLKIPQGPRTEACLRHNCVVGVQYLEAWLGGLGCVPLYNLMEDAATAEICRTQARPDPVLPPGLRYLAAGIRIRVVSHIIRCCCGRCLPLYHRRVRM